MKHPTSPIPSKPLSDKHMAILLSLLVAIMPFSVDAYLPAMPQIAQQLQANIHQIEQSLGSFILGVAFGQLLGGSLSDIKGRKNIALIGLSIYILSTIILIFIQTPEQLLGFRLIQAIGAGMSSVVVGAIVRDYYEGREAAQMFALIGIIMMAAPILAPMIGSILQTLGGWRVIFVFLGVYALSVWLLLNHFLPKATQTAPINRHIFRDVARRYQKVFQTKVALGFLFFQAASFSSMLVFLTESPFVYMELYHLNAHQYAWAFACNIIVMAIFNRITAWQLKRHTASETILLFGIGIQLLANLLFLIGVFIFELPPLAWVIACVMVSIGTQGLIVANTQALFMNDFKHEGGSANSVLASCQSLIAAMMAFLATFLHNGTIWIMAILMLSCTITGMILLYFFSRNVWLNKA